jgi:hypothetical protein
MYHNPANCQIKLINPLIECILSLINFSIKLRILLSFYTWFLFFFFFVDENVKLSVLNRGTLFEYSLKVLINFWI